MSMRDYAVDDYGVVLNSNILHVLSVQLYDDCTDESWDKDKYEFIEGVVDTLGLEYIGEFTGEALKINDDGSDYWDDADYYNSDSIYYFSVSNYPTLFKAAYKDMNELINEFKERLGKYLPENFQYRHFTRHIVGTYFG